MSDGDNTPQTSISFSFVQISDAHVGSEANRPIHDRLVAAVRLINRLRPAFVIDTGDVATHPVYDASEAHVSEFDEYARIMLSLTCPLYVVPGNHDIGYSEPGDSTWGDGNPWGDHAALCDAFSLRIGPLRRSFVHGGIRFVLCNNNPKRSGSSGYLKPTDLRWLEAELAGNEPVMLFLHVQLLVDGEGEIWGESAARIEDLCRRHGVALVAYGHKHRQTVCTRGSTTYIMCPDLKMPDHRHLLEYRVRGDRVEVQRYDVLSGRPDVWFLASVPLIRYRAEGELDAIPRSLTDC